MNEGLNIASEKYEGVGHIRFIFEGRSYNSFAMSDKQIGELIVGGCPFVRAKKSQ